MKGQSTEEDNTGFFGQVLNPEKLGQYKEILAISAVSLLALLVFVTALTVWVRRRRRLRNSETEDVERGRKIIPSPASARSSYDATAQSPRVTRARSHSWKTPPQFRKEFMDVAPGIGGSAEARRGTHAVPLFDPAQLEDSFKNYNLSLPSYRGALESIEDEGSRSEDDEAPGRYKGPGKVSLRLEYHAETLRVHIVNCKGLPAHCLWTSRGPQYFRRNPFVRVTLLPETGGQPKTFDTKERHRTLNPKFDEAFEFTVAAHELHERAVKIVVYDREERRGPKMVGMVVYPLDGVDRSTHPSSRPADETEEGELIVLDLSRHETPSKDDEPEATQRRRGSSPGDVFVGLTCNPLIGRVRINIHAMKGFRIPKDIRICGAYARVQLFHGRHLLNTKTTNAHRLPRDVSDEVSVFESFNFDIPGKFFDSVSLSVTIVAAKIPRDNVPTQDLVLGNIILGPAMFARGDALAHWQEMMSAPGEIISKWHQLEDPRGFRAKTLLSLSRSRSLDH